jgi:hypothetical protein
MKTETNEKKVESIESSRERRQERRSKVKLRSIDLEHLDDDLDADYYECNRHSKRSLR